MYSGFAVSHLGVAPGLAEEPPEFPDEIRAPEPKA